MDTKQRAIAMLSTAVITAGGLSMVDSSVADNYTEYVMQPGENLYQIAERFDVSADEIAFYNRIDNKNLVAEGQTIQIPAKQEVAVVIPEVVESYVLSEVVVEVEDTEASEEVEDTEVSEDVEDTEEVTSNYESATALDEATVYVLEETETYVLDQGTGTYVVSESSEVATIDTAVLSSDEGVETAWYYDCYYSGYGYWGYDDVYYTIQYGDTLRSIAWKYNTSVAQLAALNSISDVNVIEAGEVLLVRSGYSSGYGSAYHVVVAGDTLTAISQAYGVSVWQIASWNRIANVNLIRVGAVLRVGY